MKSFFPLFILSIFLSPISHAQNCLLTSYTSTTKNSVEVSQKNLYNASNKIIEELKEFTDRSGQMSAAKTVFEYNEKGFLSKKTEYRDSKFLVAYLYIYDDRGQLTGISENHDELSPQKLLKNVSVFGNRQEKLFFERDASVGAKEIHEKDKNGKTVLFEIQDKNGVVSHREEYTYNMGGKQTFRRNSDLVGKMIEETFSEYTAINEPLKDSTLLNGRLISKTIYTYAGILKKKTRLSGDNKVDYEIEYEYDANKRNTQEAFVYKGKIVSSFKRFYDDRNNLIREESFNEKNELVRSNTWAYQCPN